MKALDVFLISDQPTTCHYCGMRSELLSDLTHTKSKLEVHYCIECNIVFFEHDEGE